MASTLLFFLPVFSRYNGFKALYKFKDVQHNDWVYIHYEAISEHPSSHIDQKLKKEKKCSYDENS